MCLIKTHRFPKVAKENIPVYKILVKVGLGINVSASYYTPYIHKPVCVPNTMLHSSRSAIFGIFTKHIEASGVHSFKSYEDAISSYNFFRCDNFHKTKLVLFNAYIPKGSLYYEGVIGDIASSELVILDERYSIKDEDLYNKHNRYCINGYWK